MDRAAWRLVGPVHVAETREKARENLRFGLEKWLYYFREVAAQSTRHPASTILPSPES